MLDFLVGWVGLTESGLLVINLVSLSDYVMMNDRNTSNPIAFFIFCSSQSRLGTVKINLPNTKSALSAHLAPTTPGSGRKPKWARYKMDSSANKSPAVVFYLSPGI